MQFAEQPVMRPEDKHPDEEKHESIHPPGSPEGESPSGSKISGPLSGKSIASWKELLDTKTGNGGGFEVVDSTDDEDAAAELLADDDLVEIPNTADDITDPTDLPTPIESSMIDLRSEELIELPFPEDDLLSDTD